MKDTFKIIGVVLLVLIAVVGISYGAGWIGVHQAKTIGKERQNADREVYEQTQSFVESKRQAAVKYYKEYQSIDEGAKPAFRRIVAMDMANLDEEKLLTGELQQFVRMCKYSK